MFPELQKKEQRFVIICSLVLILLIYLPAIIGNFSTPDDKSFVYMAMTDHHDSNSYFSWIKQAQEGKLLFKDKFTSEYTKNLIFHPVFLFIGQVSNVFKIPVIYLWFTMIITANIFLLFTIYLFCSFFLKITYHRIIAFLLAITSSGFSWFLGYFSADSYLSEISVFRILNRPFIVAFALGLMLWFFIFALMSLKYKNPYKYALLAGLAGFLLSLIHPYDIVTVFFVLASYIIYKGHIKQNFNKLLLIFVPAIFPIMYDLIIEKIDWVIGEHNKVSIGAETSFFSIIFSFGLVFILALPAIYIILKEKKKNLYFIVFWAISSFIVIYLPFSFQWRLILGAQIPLVILATYFILYIFEKYFKNNDIDIYSFSYIKLFTVFLLMIFIFISSLTTISQYSYYFKGMLDKKYPYYIDKSIMKAISWLDNNTDNNDIIFSSNETGNFIPGRSGNTVYLGHWAQTIDYLNKLNIAKSIFSGTYTHKELDNFFHQNNIRYILYSNFERELGEGLDFSTYQKVFEENSVAIYKVN